MRFATSALALVASAAAVSAGTVTFWTLDDVQRTLYFTGNPGSAPMAPVTVSSKENTTVTFTEGFVGNFYAVKDGAVNKPGMLGEVNFAGFQDIVFFDVSAIVDPTDKDNVKQMWPKDALKPMSGCESFPCDHAYYLPDDVQTKTTATTSDLWCTLGGGSTGLALEA